MYGRTGLIAMLDGTTPGTFTFNASHVIVTGSLSRPELGENKQAAIRPLVYSHQKRRQAAKGTDYENECRR